MYHININLPAIKNIAITGVRRTAVFMGLGINAANDPELRQYELAKIAGIEFIEPITEEKTLTEFKTEFGRWIVANGLRELIETFCIFLDEIHQVCLWVDIASNGEIREETQERFEKQDKIFRRCGLKDKLAHLKDDFDVTIGESDYLVSINRARNCLTHRRGIVGTKDCLEGKELIVKWKGIDTYAETPSGEKTTLFPFPEGGFLLPVGGRIMLALLERTKIFPKGCLVTFSPRELAEICLFVLNETNVACSAVEEHARNSGITVTKPEDIKNETE